jgi:hypothetical protein
MITVTARPWKRRLTPAERSLAIRVLLVLPFVTACYFFRWDWLRVGTTEVLVWLGAVMDAPMHRLGSDMVQLDGFRIQFIVPCTMVDAFFGAIPFLWSWSAEWHRNILRMVMVFLGVFALNVGRLELGFVGLHHGVPWWLAHEVVAGVAYFCLFLFIVREYGFHSNRPRPALDKDVYDFQSEELPSGCRA